jgi:ATP-dependent helicase/nuclease subunit A
MRSTERGCARSRDERRWGTKSGLERAEDRDVAHAAAGQARAAAGRSAFGLGHRQGRAALVRQGAGAAGCGYADLAMRLHGRCAELLGMKVQADYRRSARARAGGGARLCRHLCARQAPGGRGRFQRSDPQDGRSARPAGHGRMGALQARPGHRACPDRRGAGHQSPAMGDRQRDRRRILRRRGRARRRVRTLFTVGDYKQAIFGFQGTDPIYFRAAFERFRRPVEDSGYRGWTELRIAVADPQLPLDPAGAGVRRCGDRRLPEPGMGDLSDASRMPAKCPGPGTVTLWPLDDRGRQRGG